MSTSLPFPAGGLLFPYMLGVCSQLQELGILTEATPVAGASAGSIVAVCSKSGLSTQLLTEALMDLAVVRPWGAGAGPGGLRGTGQRDCGLLRGGRGAPGRGAGCWLAGPGAGEALGKEDGKALGAQGDWGSRGPGAGVLGQWHWGTRIGAGGRGKGAGETVQVGGALRSCPTGEGIAIAVCMPGCHGSALRGCSASSQLSCDQLDPTGLTPHRHPGRTVC